MKKILLAFLMILTVQIASAQIRYGVKASANYSAIISEGLPVTDRIWEWGYDVGIMGEYEFVHQFRIQAEASFALYTSALEFNIPLSNTDVNKTRSHFELYYVNIPVVAKYYVLKNFNVFLGPQLMVKLDAISYNESTLYVNGQKVSETNTSSNVSRDINAVDFGAVGGIGYDLPNSGLGFNARYYIGFIDQHKNDDIKFHNTNVSVGASYKF
ncbi:porin family protein [Aureibacter tunicatorum]|uniref:Outer membrane protein beta-barrel domain-containing protein n=1 Tax=Aureibacter tunicatorum TaxID=866807 RepID=A0AAE3XTF2_9BACT|nr:porin family protein [Aureibacter tunicatorum]MDR6241679.1 hypothetical protein [Aureibacter tunicatorum]BDD07335.1 hypothetical protein AUTU_48180 [Aureibacter tunicatorum]